MTLSCRFVPEGFDAINPVAWDALVPPRYPFLKHAFLSLLERTGCVDPSIGWTTYPMVIESDAGELVGGIPGYLKQNSFGEFVFDQGWADAYARQGLAYYPKWIAAVPFTPATAPKLLLHQELDLEPGVVLQRVQNEIEALPVSSAHWLFTEDSVFESASPFLKRRGCQFHWFNQGYSSFDDFIGTFSSKRRKAVLSERRQVITHGIRILQLSGEAVDEGLWEQIHALYTNTFERYGNYPALHAGFFLEVGRALGSGVRVALGFQDSQLIAMAFFLVGSDTLYGRYWGAHAEIPGLHFELCYYQGIEYCIQAGLQRFEPGAQGEHKVRRGFIPTPTTSYHWIREPKFRDAIHRALLREEILMARYQEDLSSHLPFKAS